MLNVTSIRNVESSGSRVKAIFSDEINDGALLGSTSDHNHFKRHRILAAETFTGSSGILSQE
jgi:hypothetical protein